MESTMIKTIIEKKIDNPKGIYILTNSYYEKDNIRKLGYSLDLNNRLFSIENDNHINSYYECIQMAKCRK